MLIKTSKKSLTTTMQIIRKMHKQFQNNNSKTNL